MQSSFQASAVVFFLQHSPACSSATVDACSARSTCRQTFSPFIPGFVMNLGGLFPNAEPNDVSRWIFCDTRNQHGACFHYCTRDWHCMRIDMSRLFCAGDGQIVTVGFGSEHPLRVFEHDHTPCGNLGLGTDRKVGVGRHGLGYGHYTSHRGGHHVDRRRVSHHFRVWHHFQLQPGPQLAAVRTDLSDVSFFACYCWLRVSCV